MFEGVGAFIVPDLVSALARIYLNYTYLVTGVRAGLGKLRCVVEQTLALLHHFERASPFPGNAESNPMT
ncbi:hypothetical protein [Streptomyces phaeochromogenes]|uniref:hypothetical protein n=1 Tax=Streptomyces phaeochromogenes TaxID=1923 RepID=UPI0033F3F065